MSLKESTVEITPNRVYEVLNYKRPLSLRMIRNLNKGLGISAQVLISESAKPA